MCIRDRPQVGRGYDRLDIIADQPQKSTAALAVEFAHHVVQKQQWGGAQDIASHGHLRHLPGQNQRSLLTLAGK